MKQTLDEAKATVGQLQRLAESYSRVMLWSMQSQGRFGGGGHAEQNKMRASIVESLKKIGIDEKRIEQVLLVEYPFVEFAHVRYVTKLIDMETLNEEQRMSWNRFFSHDIWKGIGSHPKPDELRKFIESLNLITDEIDERLNDYAFYVRNKTHRRPGEWERREDD